MFDDELRQIGTRLIDATRTPPIAVPVTPMLEPLVETLTDADDEIEWLESLWDRSTPVVRLERIHDASPMTDSPASAIELLDLGVDRLLVISPGDLSVDLPMTAFASVERSDWATISQLVGDIYLWSVTNGELPAAGSLADRIHVSEHLDLDPLRRAIGEAITSDHVDRSDMIGIVERHSGTALDPSVSEEPAALANEYLKAAIESAAG